MSALDLRSGYFQMAVKPSDIVKTAFVTKNGTYAFRRMPFGLSGVAPNFQKAIDIILKPVIGKFVSVYMDDVIISSPSFTQHVKHLKEVFRLLHEAGPQANRTERVNRNLVQMIANYVNEQHDTWDQFLREFAYAIRTAVNETTGKTPAELFLGRNLITPFQKLVMVSDGTEFAVGDIERLFEEARRNTETKHEIGRNIIIDVGVMCKLRVLDVKNNNIVIWKAGKRLTINVDQVRIYRHRKCDEMEIGTGNSDNGSLRDESSGFDKVQRRSNDSRDGKKKGKKSRREETVTPTTSGYNLRPRIGKREESKPTIERKAQQGGPVRSRKGRERNDSPYIVERTRSSNMNARRGGDQQWQDQERRGTWTKKSLSLEVLLEYRRRSISDPWILSDILYASCIMLLIPFKTATAGSDVVQSGRPIFDDFFQHLWPYIGNNTANVVFQMVKRLWLIRIDQ
ncbi:retrovirus-related Pol polyprotein from transposon opus [Trichonephila clavipes]|uniref:Retrovirus-related Pol polyprotein from transposon opus n=1 Tax=Trichonephila clavipes TaxID=2585209 RepID=A0A8X6RKT1_TRICX|nr:retrovirus-related Pol polyprotein from transposon opus [Trichonephila clavipes]